MQIHPLMDDYDQEKCPVSAVIAYGSVGRYRGELGYIVVNDFYYGVNTLTHLTAINSILINRGDHG